MKRTGEIILVSIGIFISLIMIFIGYSFKALTENQIVYDEVVNALYEMGLTGDEINEVISSIVSLGMPITISSILLIIVGAISIYLLVGNKNAKAAGISLIVVSIISTIYSNFFVFLAGILLLIAGILALVRKEKKEEKEDYYEEL